MWASFSIHTTVFWFVFSLLDLASGHCVNKIPFRNSAFVSASSWIIPAKCVVFHWAEYSCQILANCNMYFLIQHINSALSWVFYFHFASLSLWLGFFFPVLFLSSFPFTPVLVLPYPCTARMISLFFKPSVLTVFGRQRPLYDEWKTIYRLLWI